MSKKIQEKKAKKPRPERVTLASLNRKVDLLDSRLRTLKAWETMQDAMEESRSAPAEEPLRAGDYVYLTRGHTFDAFHDTIVRVKRVYPNGSPDFDHPASATGGDATAVMWRRATPAEIASHKAKEEQRAIAKRAEDGRAKELAKPLEFGTKVKLCGNHDTPGDYIALYIQADERGPKHKLVEPGGGITYRNRHEFQILD